MFAKKTNWPVVVACGAVLALLFSGLYGWGYLTQGRKLYPTRTDYAIRLYDTEWKARLFQPAAELETLLTGEDVYTAPGLIGHRHH